MLRIYIPKSIYSINTNAFRHAEIKNIMLPTDIDKKSKNNIFEQKITLY